MIEKIDPFHPSPTEVTATYMEVGKRLLESKGPEDLIPIRAGELVVMIRESAVLRERIAELEADKLRMDYLFSEQTDLIIVDHGGVPDARLIIGREELDAAIKEREDHG